MLFGHAGFFDFFVRFASLHLGAFGVLLELDPWLLWVHKTHKDKHAHTFTNMQNTHTQTHRHTETHTHTERHTHTRTQRHTQRHTQTHTYLLCASLALSLSLSLSFTRVEGQGAHSSLCPSLSLAAFLYLSVLAYHVLVSASSYRCTCTHMCTAFVSPNCFAQSWNVSSKRVSQSRPDHIDAGLHENHSQMSQNPHGVRGGGR